MTGGGELIPCLGLATQPHHFGGLADTING